MLIEKIREDLKDAMRSRDSKRIDVLRFLLSEVKNVGINEKRELDDAVVTNVLQRLSKQRRDGIEQFKQAARPDLVEKEESELAILQSYLPTQLSEEDLEAKLRALIAEAGATSKKDMGRVMKLALERLSGAADGKRIQSIVQKLL